MITEHLMRPGSGSFRLRPDTPVSITDTIYGLIVGAGCDLIITPHPIGDPAATGDTASLGQAMHAMRITGRDSRVEFILDGIGTWLDGSVEAAVGPAAGTPTAWLTDLLINGLTVGTVSGGGNIFHTFDARVSSRREMLDYVAARGGWDYEILPDYTVNAGTSVFVTTPTVVITDSDDGPDPQYTGLRGGILNHAVDAWPQATKQVLVGQGSGPPTRIGFANQSIPLKTRTGGTPTLIAVTAVPQEPASSIDSTASILLAEQTVSSRIEVSTSTPHARRRMRPGDNIYVYSLYGGIYDNATQITYRGQTITPATKRLLTATWPLTEGLGLYVRPNAATPTWIDVTPYMQWEDGETFLDLGEVARRRPRTTGHGGTAPSGGLGMIQGGLVNANRSNPVVEQILSAPSASDAWTSFTPTWVNVATGTGGSNTGAYKYTSDGIRVIAQMILGTTGSVSGTIQVTVPLSLTASSVVPDAAQGHARFKNGTTDQPGSCGIAAGGTVITAYYGTDEANNSNPFAFGNGDQILIDITVPLD